MFLPLQSGLCVYHFLITISLLLELHFPRPFLFILSLPHLFMGTFYIDFYCLLSLAFQDSSLIFFLMREVLISQNILLRARLCKILFHHPTTTTTTTFLSNMFRSVVHFQDSLCSWVAVVHTGSFAGLKASIVKEVGSV